VIDCDFNNDRIAMIVYNEATHTSFLVLMMANYRKDVPASQYLVGLTELRGQPQALSLAEESGRLTIRVVGNEGLFSYTVPSNEDVMYQYLEMIQIVTNNLLRDPSMQTVLDRLSLDFDAFISSQDLQESLFSLLKIIFAQKHKNYRFAKTNLAEMYYRNLRV